MHGGRCFYPFPATLCRDKNYTPRGDGDTLTSNQDVKENYNEQELKFEHLRLGQLVHFVMRTL